MQQDHPSSRPASLPGDNPNSAAALPPRESRRFSQTSLPAKPVQTLLSNPNTDTGSSSTRTSDPRIRKSRFPSPHPLPPLPPPPPAVPAGAEASYQSTSDSARIRALQMELDSLRTRERAHASEVERLWLREKTRNAEIERMREREREMEARLDSLTSKVERAEDRIRQAERRLRSTDPDEGMFEAQGNTLLELISSAEEHAKGLRAAVRKEYRSRKSTQMELKAAQERLEEERKRYDRIVRTIKAEGREPFIVPALLDALLTLETETERILCDRG
ncbi:hypothetical protein OF83DRAFT_354025 [Amylostereum chailletii]|nr:hypothetical protein OF83DRAFT_354025 [Amylostereum chailletii]